MLFTAGCLLRRRSLLNSSSPSAQVSTKLVDRRCARRLGRLIGDISIFFCQKVCGRFGWLGVRRCFPSTATICTTVGHHLRRIITFQLFFGIDLAYLLHLFVYNAENCCTIILVLLGMMLIGWLPDRRFSWLLLMMFAVKSIIARPFCLQKACAAKTSKRRYRLWIVFLLVNSANDTSSFGSFWRMACHCCRRSLLKQHHGNRSTGYHRRSSCSSILCFVV